MKLRIVIDESDSTFGAHVPDRPGCVAVGRTLEEVKELIANAITAHVALLRERGLSVTEPRPRT